jgi:hypothetical protein
VTKLVVIVFISLLLLLGLLFAHFKWNFFRTRLHPWLDQNKDILEAYSSVFTILGFPLVIFGGYYTYNELSQKFSRPAVALTFASPLEATISIWNTSSVVVHDPKYTVVLLNVDDPATFPDPLPIPTAKADYIQPQRRWGPNQMIGQNKVKARVKPGNRLVGWVSVLCPTCQARHYWLYIQHGASGWFAAMEEDEFPDMAKISSIIKEKVPETFFKSFMATVPEAKRIPLSDSPYSKEALPEELGE